MSKDDLEDRIKRYESVHTGTKLIPYLPIIIRVDGNCFHTYTREMKRPFDDKLIASMNGTAEYLAKYTSAKIAYVQSDEITLVLYSDNIESVMLYNGKVHKISSIIAGLAGGKLTEIMRGFGYIGDFAVFDCRVFQVPTLWEAVNTLIWREKDAMKNSLQMVARSVYSPKDLHKKKTSDLHDMLHVKGINWNDYCPRKKRGGYIIRTDREIGSSGVIRHSYQYDESFPELGKIKNPVEVIFEGAEPEMKS